MKKLIPVFAVVCIYILTGCAARQPEYDPSIVPPKSANNQVVVDSVNPSEAVVPVPADPTKAVPVVSATTPAPVTNTAAGMNPPHGQPGHRCDIAVGAPLNSKPTPAAKTVATTPVKMDATPVKNAAGARLNPPHGQPGHDCAIPVGQPLKS